VTTPPLAPSASEAALSRVPRERGTWALSRRGLTTVVRLELRQRVRSSRWLLMLGLWFVTIAVIFGLTLAVIGGSDDAGAYLFGAIAFLVLTLGLLVAPALSATSVNGDRASGTLATMQMTLLTPSEMAVGKLLAAWGTALVFLAVGSPFLLASLALGGTSLPRAVVTLVMLALILLTVCAIALGWSALTARLASSAVLTYLSVAFLCIGTLIFFGLSVPLVQTDDKVQVLTTPPGYDFSSSTPLPRSECLVVTELRNRTHTEYTWWLLAANPYVVVADAAPRDPGTEDVLSVIGQGARAARDGAKEPVDECYGLRRRAARLRRVTAAVRSGVAPRAGGERPAGRARADGCGAQAADPGRHPATRNQDRLTTSAGPSGVQCGELRVGDDLVVRVQAQVGQHGMQHPQRAGRAVAPGGQVGELPPPEGLGDATGLVVAQPVGQCGGDVDKVVRERAAGQLDAGQGVDDVRVLVQPVQEILQRLPQRVDVGVRTGVRLEPLARHDVGDGAEPRARDQHLGHGEQQDRQCCLSLGTRGDLGEGLQVRACLTGGVVRHRREGVVVAWPRPGVDLSGHAPLLALSIGSPE